jgi:hypothetical protein
MLAMATPMQPALATDFRLHCTPTTSDALALCDAFANTLMQAGWQKSDAGMVLQMEVQNLRPTSIRVALTLTAPDGRTHVVNRALSASDTTINQTMQAAFLKKLLSAIPSTF